MTTFFAFNTVNENNIFQQEDESHDNFLGISDLWENVFILFYCINFQLHLTTTNEAFHNLATFHCQQQNKDLYFSYLMPAGGLLLKATNVWKNKFKSAKVH